VDVDIDGACSLPGLYAAGEAACVSLNGANRLGSNSLTECLVFGARAGQHAARFAKGTGAGSETALVEQAKSEGARIDGLRGRKRGGETISAVRLALNAAMEAGTGVYREQGTMQKAVTDVAALAQRFEQISLSDTSRVFNTEVTALLELRNLLDVAEAVALAAVNRKESRGAHACRDFPKRNDGEYLRHSLVHFGAGGPRFSTKPVTLGTWVPEERKY
jgi:fumarate reductase flavoprotein subunit